MVVRWRTSSTLTSRAFRSSSASTTRSRSCSLFMQSPVVLRHPYRSRSFSAVSAPGRRPVAAALVDEVAHRIRHQKPRIAPGPDQRPDVRGGDLELGHGVYIDAACPGLVQIADAPRAAVDQQLAEGAH